MPQSRVGSMQGSTEGSLKPKVVFHQRSSSTKGRLPPKDLQGGRTKNVTQRTDTHKGGGRTHSVTKRTDTQGGGMHPQCNPTNGHTKLTVTDRHAEGQSNL